MPATRMACFWQGKPDTSHITKLQISLVQHPGTSVCDAMQQHFLFSCVIKGGITKTPFPTCQNPAKKSSTSLHRNGAGDLTEFSFRSLRTQSALRLRGGILYIVSPALSREESCHLHNNRYFKRFFFLIMPQNIL